MARGVERRDIFIDDHDRERFLNGMRRMERESSAQIIAYCLMGNHFHFAIQIGPIPLGRLMQRFLGGYVTGFNSRYERTGHLFHARYKANLCMDDRYLYCLIHYIHMNPVRAGLVTAPEAWPWSSYSPGGEALPDLSEFDPWPESTQVIDLTRREEVVDDLDQIGSTIASRTGISVENLRSRRRVRSIVAARRLFVLAAIKNGHALVASAHWLNTTRSSISRYACANSATTGGLTPI